MKRSILLLVVIFQCMAPLATADIIKAVEGKSLKTARGFDIEAKLRNDDAKFGVRVTVDHDDCIYEKGELMEVTVFSEKSGYLYLLYKQADGSTKCLFPNLFESDNWIEAKTFITIPTEKQNFQLRCNAPFGDELLTAVVSKQRLDPRREFGARSLTQERFTDVNMKSLARSIEQARNVKNGKIPKGMEVEANLPLIELDKLAEHSVNITSVLKRKDINARSKAQWLGLFIGISTFKDSGIPQLKLCHKDALAMADVMKKSGQLNGIGTLLNEEATRKNIEDAFRELKLRSRPGDKIIIYWSGHGAYCADDDGDETTDGFDEYLVPHDADTNKILSTIITDDALGRWIQELDGRKVLVIFDACHSGGVAEVKINETGTKSATESLKPATIQIGGARPSTDGRDFMWKTQDRIQSLLCTKDIRTQDATMLLSCKAGETSAERRDGKLSVMTHFLVKKIITSDSLTLKEAYDYIKVEVPKYMKEYYPNHPQTPQLLPEDGANVKLK